MSRNCVGVGCRGEATAGVASRTEARMRCLHARTPGGGANLVKGGIGSLPPEMQAAIMQATQFSPNGTAG